MNQYCTPLEIDVFPLKDSIDLNEFYNNMYMSLKHDMLNPNLVDLLRSVGLRVTFIEKFRRFPNEQTQIHTDGAGGDYVKINWVLGSEGSTMLWYQPKPGQQKTITKNSVRNTSYISYTADEVDCVYIKEIKSPSLVQVGIPHNVHTSDKMRLCISLVLKPIKGNSRISMHQAQKLLSNYIGRS